MPSTLTLPFDVAVPRRDEPTDRSRGRLGAPRRGRPARPDDGRCRPQSAAPLVEDPVRERGEATGEPSVATSEPPVAESVRECGEVTGVPLVAGAAHGGATLDQVILGAWNELTAHTAVACPVCRGKMVPRYGSESLPVGGRCRRCGTTLG
jgi:hypothetical protein